MSQGYNLIRADNKKLLKKFVDFPFQLYQNSGYWVPPIRNEELTAMLPEKNPSLLDSEFGYWLVLDGHRVVGRVAGYVTVSYTHLPSPRDMRRSRMPSSA